jgi:lipoprotein-anchoring transpeptidase ErfK/SrfK
LEEREDNHYLKQYVKHHPDNQMAWYLLGKNYMQQGKEAKANYCFLQAGDVYEAYERKKNPMIAQSPEQAIKQWNRQRRLKSLAARTILTTLLLLSLSVAAPSSPWNPWLGGPQTTEEALPALLELAAPTGVGVIFINRTEASPIGKALDSLVYGQAAPAYGLAVRLEQVNSWRNWTGATKIILSVDRPAGGAEASIRLLDAGTCRCRPADAARAYQTLAQWTGQREQQWVLESAIIRYKEIYRVWPDSLEQLVRPYPDNVLSGDTPAMKTMFPEALQLVKNAAAQGSNNKPVEESADGKSGTGDPSAAKGIVRNAGMPDKLPAKPLEIIVDKQNHRLALVSGDVIIRSYTIGLGGKQTPEGSFTISEKVRDPNGRDNGDFGSRGMTLSDTLYAIHGTNEPQSIGRDDSLGCVRMKKEDVEELFDMAPLGTKVTIKKGVLPDSAAASNETFKLTPKQKETNPDKVYRWL